MTAYNVETPVHNVETVIQSRRVFRGRVLRSPRRIMHMLRAILVIALASSVCTYTHTGSDTGSER